MKIHILDLHFLEKTEAIAAFLVVGKTGVSLVETGAHSTFPQLETEVKKHGFQISDIKKVFLSHIHFDHAGAAWAIAEQSGAQIFVHPKGLPHLAAPEKLYNSARQIYGSDMERLWGEMRAIPENQLVAPAHGEIIESGGVHFRAWHTPGHAVHHIAWEVSEPGAPSERLGRAGHSRPVVFTGDVGGVKIGRRGIAVPPCPPPDVNIEDWLASIELLRNLPVETFYHSFWKNNGQKTTPRRPRTTARGIRRLDETAF